MERCKFIPKVCAVYVVLTLAGIALWSYKPPEEDVPAAVALRNKNTEESPSVHHNKGLTPDEDDSINTRF